MCGPTPFGEHHGLDYIYSAPPVILAAIAERTTNLRLSTAVTLAANLDPVRAAEDYATVDVLSGGRCEVVVGRGNIFASTYTLFGQRVEDSTDLFAERVELLTRLWSGEPVNWPGSRHRAPIDGFELQPHRSMGCPCGWAAAPPKRPSTSPPGSAWT